MKGGVASDAPMRNPGRLGVTARRLLTFAFMVLVAFFVIWKTTSLIITSYDLQTDGRGFERHTLGLLGHGDRPTGVEGISVEERKTLRWPLRLALTHAYLGVGDLAALPRGPGYYRLVTYVDQAVHAVCIALGLLFIVLIVGRVSGSGSNHDAQAWMWGFIAVAYIIAVGGWKDPYTTFEFMAISGVVYAAIARRLWLYFLMATIAVANRETGVVVGLLIVLFAWQGPRTFVYAAYPGLLFVAFNFQILSDPDLYSASVVSTAGSERPSMLDFWNYAPQEWLAFWAYTLLLYAPLFRSGLPRLADPLRARLAIGLALYFLMLAVGTFLGNLFPHMILLAFLVPLVVLAHEKQVAN